MAWSRHAVFLLDRQTLASLQAADSRSLVVEMVVVHLPEQVVEVVPEHSPAWDPINLLPIARSTSVPLLFLLAAAGSAQVT